MDISSAAMRTMNICYVNIVLSFIFLALKLGVRSWVVKSLGWDDLFVTLSFIISIPLTLSIYMQAKHGMGKHAADLPTEHLVEQTKWFWASILLYVAALGFSKISILMQYLRIFISRRTVVAIWACVAFVLAYTVQGLFVGIFQCNPPEAFWDRTVKATCINQIVYFFLAAALNMVTDFAIIMLPIPALRSLHVSRSRKIGLILSFSIGGFGCVISLIRLHALVELKPFVEVGDVSFENTNTAMWSVVEVHICIICACLPSLRPVLTRLLALTGLHRSATSPGKTTPSPSTPFGTTTTTSASNASRIAAYHQREADSWPPPPPPLPRRSTSASLSAAFFGGATVSASASRENSLRTMRHPDDVELGHKHHHDSRGGSSSGGGGGAPQLGVIAVETRLEVHSTISGDATLVDSRTGSRSSRESEELRLVPEAHRGWYRALVERDRR